MVNKASNKRASPFSVRLSDAEREELVRRANESGLSIGGYWKSAVFNTPPPRKSRRPSVEHVALAKLLPHLGKIGSNVNQLARRINTEGNVSLPELIRALEDIATMRAAIMSALGYDVSEDRSIADTFNRHSQ